VKTPAPANGGKVDFYVSLSLNRVSYWKSSSYG